MAISCEPRAHQLQLPSFSKHMKPSLSHLINSKWTKLAARDRFAKHQRRNATCSAALPFVFQAMAPFLFSSQSGPASAPGGF
ncbi:hypothetical protein PHYPO_G00145130 [Pangasianodon hypophthalmus]|uniref:Uncharacterized protein n=1 Tax=Pangasianodon hypophthalmus TaxID=310915 RepID=A0A5N5K4T2_PANHP|nr:hypothetical protein PHYPO_G00145130 [Pangasianodon hypophthalmus]